MKTPGRERNDYTVDQQTPTEWKSQNVWHFLLLTLHFLLLALGVGASKKGRGLDFASAFSVNNIVWRGWNMEIVYFTDRRGAMETLYGGYKNCLVKSSVSSVH